MTRYTHSNSYLVKCDLISIDLSKKLLKETSYEQKLTLNVKQSEHRFFKTAYKQKKILNVKYYEHRVFIICTIFCEFIFL